MLEVTGGGAQSAPFALSFAARLLDQKDEPIVGLSLRIGLADLDSKELVTEWHGATDQHGTTRVLILDAQARQPATWMDGITLEFPGDWQSDLAKIGEAVEISPARISMFLKCKKGSCRVEAEDYQPLKDFTFRVKRIEHIDQAQKAAYATQLKDEEREAHAAAQRQLEKDLAEVKRRQDEEAKEVKRKQEEGAKEIRRLEKFRQNRDKAHFKSFEDAQTFLSSLGDGGDKDPEEYGYAIAMARDPMSLKGRVIVMRVKIVQTNGIGQFLMTNYPSVYSMFPGSDMRDGLCMGFVTPHYEGSKEFVDDQIVDIVAEVTGTIQYATAMMGSKTVPKLRIYGIRASGVEP